MTLKLFAMAALSTIVILGCATSTSMAPLEDWPKHRTTVAQFCVTKPTSNAFFKFIHVNFYPNGQAASSGSSNAYPVGLTTTGQVVFEGYGGAPPTLLRAVLTFGGAQLKYVYLPTAPVLEDRWTAWQVADFQSNDYDISHKLLYSSKYESQPVSDNATRVRFRVKTCLEYRHDLDIGRSGNGPKDIPPC